VRTLPHRVLPVLLYHRFGTSPTGDPNLWIPTERFSAQLQWLTDHGYRTLSLDETFEHLSAGRVPGRSVLLTIDDGFAESLQLAAEALSRHAMRATVFVAADLVGRQAELRHPAGGDSMVSTGRIADRLGLIRWLEQGLDIGSHSLTHRDLRGCDAEVVRREAGESKRRLEDLLSRPVLDFCYPYTHHDAVSRGEVAVAGYRAAYAGEPPQNDLFAIPRMMVYPQDSEARFRRKVSGYYFWISAWHQRLRRFMGN